jgi:hypothetical protein
VLKQAAEADASTAAMLLDATEIRPENNSMTTCYDRHGIRYEIPIFIINDPISFTEGKLAPSKRRKAAKEEDISFKIRCFNVSQTDIELTLANTSTVE